MKLKQVKELLANIPDEKAEILLASDEELNDVYDDLGVYRLGKTNQYVLFGFSHSRIDTEQLG